jgi:hypothetical protein
MRGNEKWSDITREFLEWCHREKKLLNGGCHEGDAISSTDGLRYAAISIPDHSPKILGYLIEWAGLEGRTIK